MGPDSTPEDGVFRVRTSLHMHRVPIRTMRVLCHGHIIGRRIRNAIAIMDFVEVIGQQARATLASKLP
jgi:hypothetical protein